MAAAVPVGEDGTANLISRSAGSVGLVDLKHAGTASPVFVPEVRSTTSVHMYRQEKLILQHICSNP